jgi:hypothetical protein
MTRRLLILAVAAVSALAPPASALQREESWASAETLSTARAEAPLVVIAFIHSARQPRGTSGLCPADGRVVQVERGRGVAYGDKVGVLVPCAAMAHEGRPVRRIPMAFMWDPAYARLYFTARRGLVDYEVLQLRPAPLPRFWQAQPSAN